MKRKFVATVYYEARSNDTKDHERIIGECLDSLAIELTPTDIHCDEYLNSSERLCREEVKQ